MVTTNLISQFLDKSAEISSREKSKYPSSAKLNFLFRFSK